MLFTEINAAAAAEFQSVSKLISGIKVKE